MALYERLSAQDRSFLDLERPHTPMHVAGCFVYEMGPLLRPDGSLDIERVRAYVASRLHRIPRYRQRIATVPLERHPVWVDDPRFNLQYHVRHTALPPPGDDRQLKRLCGRILSQQLDRGKPLWEIWVIEGLEHERVALVTKSHHCMLDGVSANDLLRELLSPVPEKEFEPAHPWQPNPLPSGARLLADATWRRATTPLRLFGAALRAARRPEELRARAEEIFSGLPEALVGLKPASDTPFNRPIGPHRRLDWLAFDLDEVKRVKRELGGTVNDVVLATVAGAIGRFLLERGITLPTQRRMDFRAFCPVSVRGHDEAGTFGNRLASMIARLPVAEQDPTRRLAEVRRVMGDLKHAKQAIGAEVLSSVSEWIAPALFGLAARLAFRSRASNLVVTNVPGPQVPLYLLGARMLETYPMAPLFENQGVAIALFSYAGGLYWGVNSDWDLFPDLHELVKAIDASFQELCDAATTAGVRSPTQEQA